MKMLMRIVVILTAFAAGSVSAEPPAPAAPSKHPLAIEHPIVIDATLIVPPRYWTVPGKTEPLQSVRGRVMTDKIMTLQLRPGRYQFMTTIFSFEFTVDLDGKLDYPIRFEKCVGGRGTETLKVKCSTLGNAVGPG